MVHCAVMTRLRFDNAAFEVELNGDTTLNNNLAD